VNRTLARTTPWLVAVVVVLVSSALAGVLIVSAPPGIPVSSIGVQLLLPVTRVLADLAGILVVGCLLAAGILLDSPDGELGGGATSMLVLGSRVALAWLVAVFASAVLTLSDVFGLPVISALSQTAAIPFLTQSVVGHAFLAQMVGAAVIAVAGPFATRRWQAHALLCVAAVTVASRSTAGHSGVASDHEAVTVLLAAHVIAVALWVGGLAAIGLLLLRREAFSPAVANRFSAVALWCVTAVAVTGVAQVLLRIPDPLDLFTTAYGLLLVGKSMMLAVLIALGWLQRRWSLPALERGARRPFARMVFVEIVLMAVVLGVSVTLSRTPTVSRGQGTGAEAHVHPQAGPPVGVVDLLGQWRVDGALILACLALVIVYAAWRSRVLSLDMRWSGGQVACFASGLIVLLLVSCSGLGTYVQFMASALIVHSILLLLVAPTLVVLGIPVAELARQRWSMRTDPGIPIVVTMVFLVAVFATPAIGYLLWPFWGRAFLNLALLCMGLWVCSTVLVAARGTGRSHLVPLVALATGVAGLILVALAVPGIIAPKYFVFFIPPYVDDLVHDEVVGLVSALAIVVGWLLVLIAVTARKATPISAPPDTVSAGARR
jgi:putative copper export protein/cytochrome c oxidase assembly factor CtaG